MFVYKDWDKFCRTLSESGIKSITAVEELHKKDKQFLILKHDVEDVPRKALSLAKIEAKYGHRGVYYAQAYLMKEKNISIFEQIKKLGHEVSYHHDVMDATEGHIEKALQIFEENKKIFEQYGFKISTVCQHGNPIAKRIGYHSNRDFFRNDYIKTQLPDISEIMVDFKKRIGTDYKYISDAGYSWKMIFDPETNDIDDSSDRDMTIGNLENLVDFVRKNTAVIVSTHPHRWCKSNISAKIKNCVFLLVRRTARILYKIPGIKNILEKFYFLAKKI